MLTTTQLKVLQLRVNGLNYQRIADKRGNSVHTIETHFTNMMKRLKVHSVIEVIAMAFREGWIK